MSGWVPLVFLGLFAACMQFQHTRRDVPWRVLNATGSTTAVREIQAIIQRVENWFLRFGERPERSIDAELTIVVHAMDNPLASESVMTTQSGIVYGRYHATVHCLWKDPDSESTVRWFRKNVAHEIASVCCDAVTRNRGTGWGFFDAPSWFVQGLPEWIGRTLYDPAWEASALPADAPKTRALERVGENGHIVPREAYDGGAWLVERLVRARGAEILVRLLNEDAPTFEAAFVSAFGVSQREFASRL